MRKIYIIVLLLIAYMNILLPEEIQLQEIDHEITSVHCIKDGLETAQSLRPAIILLDMHLPDADGCAHSGGVYQCLDPPVGHDCRDFYWWTWSAGAGRSQ